MAPPLLPSISPCYIFTRSSSVVIPRAAVFITRGPTPSPFHLPMLHIYQDIQRSYSQGQQFSSPVTPPLLPSISPYYIFTRTSSVVIPKAAVFITRGPTPSPFHPSMLHIYQDIQRSYSQEQQFSYQRSIHTGNPHTTEDSDLKRGKIPSKWIRHNDI